MKAAEQNLRRYLFVGRNQPAGVHQTDRKRRDQDETDHLADIGDSRNDRHREPVAEHEKTQQSRLPAKDREAIDKPAKAAFGRKSQYLHGITTESVRNEYILIGGIGRTGQHGQKDKKTRLYTIMYLLFGNRSDTIGVTITK